MEILLTTLGILTIVTLTIIVGTGGKPMRAVSAFKETVKAINANRGPLAITALSVVVLLVFLYLFYFFPNRNMAPEQLRDALPGIDAAMSCWGTPTFWLRPRRM